MIPADYPAVGGMITVRWAYTIRNCLLDGIIHPDIPVGVHKFAIRPESDRSVQTHSAFESAIKKALVEGFFRDPGATRTRNRQNRNLVFYPIELRDHNPCKFKKYD